MQYASEGNFSIRMCFKNLGIVVKSFLTTIIRPNCVVVKARLKSLSVYKAAQLSRLCSVWRLPNDSVGVGWFGNHK